MKIFFMFLGQFKWHYSKGLKSIFFIWKNFLVFITQFFSLKYLVQNFFDTWKRMSDPYPKSFSFKVYLSTFLVNLIARIVGMIMRAVLLVVGLMVCIIFCLLLPISIIVWLLLPFILIVMAGAGLYLIFKK